MLSASNTMGARQIIMSHSDRLESSKIGATMNHVCINIRFYL